MNFDNDILSELKYISPFLAGAEKINVFTVPQDYFEHISGQFFLNLSRAPFSTIDNLSVAVPKGYFDNLSSFILDRIKAENSPSASTDIEISTWLKQAGKTNVYEYPEGYFDGLSNSILTGIYKDNDNEDVEILTMHPSLQGLQFVNIFETPAFYFDTLPTEIYQKIVVATTGLEQQETGSDLLKIATQNTVFQLPPNYFEELSGQIIAAIKVNAGDTAITDSLSISIKQIQHLNVFEVPENYFNTISTSIIDTINNQNILLASEEIEALSPLLQGVQKRQVYEVPPGYFENLSNQAFAINKPADVKVIKMPARVNFARLAAAAVITALLATGIYNFSSKPTGYTDIAAVNNANNITSDSIVEKGKKMNDVQFDEALNNLSKEDVINYLEKNNSEDDMALLTSNLDISTLPDKDDYLLDEKTLDNYLEVIKSQN